MITITLELLEKIFRDIEQDNFLMEARAKAFMFFDFVKRFNLPIGDDYWIQLGKNWDLNISNGTDLTLYPVYQKNGYFETDTTDGVVLRKTTLDES